MQFRFSVLSVFLLAIAGCSSEPAIRYQTTDLQVDAGRAAWQEHCASCHGSELQGTEKGPTLIHDMYAPDHHNDKKLRRSIAAGVLQKHWYFGDMPPQPQIGYLKASDLVTYIRFIQQQQGLY